jgi:hypothetical protein
MLMLRPASMAASVDGTDSGQTGAGKPASSTSVQHASLMKRSIAG